MSAPSPKINAPRRGRSSGSHTISGYPDRVRGVDDLGLCVRITPFAVIELLFERFFVFFGFGRLALDFCLRFPVRFLFGVFLRLFL